MNRNRRIVSVLFTFALGASCVERPDTGPAPAIERTQSALVGNPATKISAQAFHTCAVLESHEVVCWGYNIDGQLGNTTSRFSSVPVKVTLPDDAADVSAGIAHTCAALANGQVACWGAGDSGQLGNGTFNSSATPVIVNGLTDAVAVAAGQWSSCALRSSGQVVCWGDNSQFELGSGNGQSSNVPVAVVGLTDAKEIAAAGEHACARRENGQVVCWGYNGRGQLGGGNSSTPASSTPVTVVGLSDAATIAAGQLHVCAVRTNGQAVCWGDGSWGQLGMGNPSRADAPVAVPSLSDAAAIAAGYFHTCIARTSGGVFCWGDSTFGKLGSAGVSTGAVSVAAGYSHTCALDGNGEIVCWGQGTYGELGNGSASLSPVPVAAAGITNAVAVAAIGSGRTCAVRADGRVSCWGDDQTLPVEADGINGAVAITGSHKGSCTLGGDGSVKCWGDLVSDEDTSILAPTTILGDGLDIDALDGRMCAARTSGEVACWGLTANGSVSMTPVTVTGVSDAVAVAVGGTHVCAVRTGGAVVCWGSGSFGQLGNGDLAATTTPVTVSGLSDATTIAAGDIHVCARRAGGSVVCWGDGRLGQLGNGSVAPSSVRVSVTGLSDAQAIAAGNSHTCAVRAGGSVVCWGDGNDGQLGNGTTGSAATTPVTVAGLSDAVAISAGRSHTCAVRAGGQVVCWGSDRSGALGNGSPWRSDRPVPVSGLSSLLAFGGSCTGGATCASGLCIDGVCCAATCGSDATDCNACSVAAGGTADGLCTVRTGKTCGGATAICETRVCSADATCLAPTAVPMCVSGSVAASSTSTSITVSDSSMGGYAITITFPAGVTAGDVGVVPCGVDTPQPPSQYEILGGATAPACWDIHTTASYSTPPDLTVCITYPPEVVDGIDDPSSVLAMAHFTSSGPSMITTTGPAGQVCGTTPSLSPFAIVVPHDLTKPVFGPVPGPIVTYATSAAGAPVTYATPPAVDADSGPPTVTCLPASGSTFPLGHSSVTCTATDKVGNKAKATIPVWVQVQAPTDGSFFLAPINADGSSIFKVGSTIPVKFQLTGASAGIANLTAHLSVTNISSSVSGTELEATSNGAANSGDLFRYDAGTRQYVFNLSTKPFSAGTWSLRADLGDAVAHQINVSLKK